MQSCTIRCKGNRKITIVITVVLVTIALILVSCFIAMNAKLHYTYHKTTPAKNVVLMAVTMMLMYSMACRWLPYTNYFSHRQNMLGETKRALKVMQCKLRVMTVCSCYGVIDRIYCIYFSHVTRIVQYKHYRMWTIQYTQMVVMNNQ